jgi:DNA polymerase
MANRTENNQLSLLEETVPQNQEAEKKPRTKKDARPTRQEQEKAVGLKSVVPELYQALIENGQNILAPGMPTKVNGILVPGKPTEWFARRGTGKNKILLVGAYPSDEEQKQHKVLVGKSGREIGAMLQKLNINMEECWMTNVVRYYYPAGTNVPQAAIDQGTAYLQAEIEYLKPELILCLGSTALQAVEDKDALLENYLGHRWRQPGKSYEIAAVWQPAHVLRKPELKGVWEDHLKAIFGRKPLLPFATDWRIQDKLKKRNIENLRALNGEIDDMIRLNETTFAIDLEYHGDNPNTSMVLSIQIASASRTLNIIVRRGHWKPRIYLKNTGKDARPKPWPPAHVSESVVNKGYATTKTELGWSLARIYLTLQSIEKEHEERVQIKFQHIKNTQGEQAAKLWLERLQTEEEKAMADGKVRVFLQEADLHEWLAENDKKIHSNLIAYVIGSDYVFDVDEVTIGKALARLINKERNVKLTGQNGNVDWTRLEARCKLECTDLVIFDTMTAAVMLDEGQPRGLEDLAHRYLNAPNHKLPLLTHMRNRGLADQPYCFCAPHILDPYGMTDARRSLDLLMPMSYMLSQESAFLDERKNVSNVPLTKIGDTENEFTPRRTDLQVNNWENGNTLKSAYANFKNPQMLALCEPMLIGQPFNPENMAKLIDWYEDALEKQLQKCRDIISMHWVEPRDGNRNSFKGQNIANHSEEKILEQIATKGYVEAENTLGTDREILRHYVLERQEKYLAIRQANREKIMENAGTPGINFNPNSADQTAYLLHYILGLQPSKATNGKDWNPAMHRAWTQEIKAKKKNIKIKPTTGSEELEMLSGQNEIAKLIADTRYISTIVKNYMKRGGRWTKTRSATTPKFYIAAEDKTTRDEILLNPDNFDQDQVDDANAEAMAAAEKDAEGRDWAAYEKNQDAKAISLLLDEDNRIYSCYFPTLETQRLATRPNISAIIRGENRYVIDIIGEEPPMSIRELNEAPDDWFISSNDWKSAEVWMIAILARLRSRKRGPEKSNLWNIATDPTQCVHASTARKMFPAILDKLTDKEIKQLYPHLRELAKPVVFGIPYGRGAKAIATQLNTEAVKQYMGKRAKWIKEGRQGPAPSLDKPITTEEAQDFIAAYFELAPECWDFLTEQKSLVHTPGFQINPWGFVRRYPKATNREEIAEQERQAANWQIQSGVACAMMQTTTKWRTNYRQKYKRLPMYLIDILHDATKFLFHKSMLGYHNEIIEDIMGTGIKLPFPHEKPLGVDPTIYKAYERKEYSESIDLDHPDPKKRDKTFLGKYGDTPENREFYKKYDKKSDFMRFLMKYGATESDTTKTQSLAEISLAHV